MYVFKRLSVSLPDCLLSFTPSATYAQFVSRREVPNILPDEVSRNKKVDIIIDNFNCLCVGPLAIDVVVVNAYAEGTGMPLQPYSETRNVPASEFCTSQN